MKIPPDEHDLHAYVDARLDESERAIIEHYLAQHPHIAQEVNGWREDTQRLRTILAGQFLPDVTTSLDPVAIRVRQVRRTHRRMRLVASFILCITLSSLGGWFSRSWQTTVSAPMGDAISAYKLMVVEKSMPADFISDGATALSAWLMQHVGAAVKLPDLREAGFEPVSGRLFVTDQGAAAMVLYRDSNGLIISFYIRPSDPLQPPLPAGQRTTDGLIAIYGSSQGLNYAVVGPADMVNNPAVSHELSKQT